MSLLSVQVADARCSSCCFPLSLLYSSTLIRISRGFPRCVIVMGPCRARAMMSPDLRERSDVE